MSRTIPQGLVDTGQTVALPAPVYGELLESDPQMDLTAPVIPLYHVAKWTDERMFCRAARLEDSEAAQSCPLLLSGWRCSAGGIQTPCVFAEPDSAKIWQDIRAYVRECQEKGWPIV